MDFALFIGCKIPHHLKHYESSARAVLEVLGVEVTDIPAFNCCGYPVRNADFHTFVLLSGRNLALAEERGLDIMALCKCCFGSLKKVDHLLKNDTTLREEINNILKREDLSYQGKVEVTHFLSVLHRDIGVKAIGEKISRPYKGLKVATHYGCHALRPSDVTNFDDAVSPSLFEDLVTVTGAKSVEWPLRLECCGAPLMGINDELSVDLMTRKLQTARECGADYVCVSCPWCQVQFDEVQESRNGKGPGVPSILYSQLLGKVMGIEDGILGIEENRLDISGIQGYLSEEKV
ncbi:MAG: CoB--CoM heterodisulfide reductase iron-sulfur subunit B family protein [Deltaproteobacteria bacterium]|nr:CoB--CoM heterodisulfide reductase iron-sulfur subunit B family protein [Deltaproteobacteria bacterium]